MIGGVISGGSSGKAKVEASGTIKLGTSAGILLDSSDTNNIVIGTSALSSSGGVASDNIAIGTNALAGNNTGDSNVAIGKDAAITLNSQSNNVFIGKNAGKLAGAPTRCTFIGSGAGEELGSHTMADNTLIGYLACGNATGSNQFTGNVVIGSNAGGGESGMLGYENTIIGYKAGYDLESLAYNCLFIGAHAGEDSTHGNGTIIGSNIKNYSGGNYLGLLSIGTDSFPCIERLSYKKFMSGSYTNANTDQRAATSALIKIPAYSFITKVIARVDTLGNGTHKYSVCYGTASDESSGDVIAGYTELLGASPGTGSVVRSAGSQTSASDIDASSGATDEMLYIANINTETNSSIGWGTVDRYIYLAHAGTGNSTTDPGTDPCIHIVVEYYSLKDCSA